MRDRSTFLYMEPADPKNDDFAQCGTCIEWIKDKDRCYLHRTSDEIDADDSCGLYVEGEPRSGLKPLGLVTPKVSGLVDEQTRCHNCNAYDGRDQSHIHCDLYVQLNRMFPHVFDLKEEIEPHACCNAMEPGKRDPKRFGPYGPIPDADDPKVGGLVTRLRKSGQISDRMAGAHMKKR
jgi:hypothetical protein